MKRMPCLVGVASLAVFLAERARPNTAPLPQATHPQGVPLVAPRTLPRPPTTSS